MRSSRGAGDPPNRLHLTRNEDPSRGNTSAAAVKSQSKSKTPGDASKSAVSRTNTASQPDSSITDGVSERASSDWTWRPVLAEPVSTTLSHSGGDGCLDRLRVFGKHLHQ